MFEELLVERLKEAVDHIYPGAAPLNYSLPCCCYNRISTDPDRDMDGNSDYAFIRLELRVFDTRFKTALQKAKEIKSLLATWGHEDIQYCAWTDENHLIDDSTETRLYFVDLTFILFGRFA